MRSSWDDTLERGAEDGGIGVLVSSHVGSSGGVSPLPGLVDASRPHLPSS